MTTSIIIVIAHALKNVCEQMIKNNFRKEGINVLQELINNMKHSDRWGTIENSKTYFFWRCTYYFS